MLTRRKAQAYRAMVQAGEISGLTILRSVKDSIDIVEYLSSCPHDWMREQIAKQAQTEIEQIMME